LTEHNDLPQKTEASGPAVFSRRYRWTFSLLAFVIVLGIAFVAWNQLNLLGDPEYWQKTFDPDRETWPATVKILELLDIEEGHSFLDIGAGAGFYSFLVARMVGPEGRVYATDIDPKMIVQMKMAKMKVGQKNLEAVWVGRGKVGVAPGSVDRILILNVYIEPLSKPLSADLC
jgi:predicted methyltransferase